MPTRKRELIQCGLPIRNYSTETILIGEVPDCDHHIQFMHIIIEPFQIFPF